jgi:hypothetical protein
MILFYSETCQHCSVLLDTIKRHDSKKTIKIVCIDTKINIIKDIIKNVPALMFLPTKEVIYGKAVFDYLLLPNRGYLFTSKSGRNNKEDTTPSSLSSPIPLNENSINNDPEAFSLGSIYADNFSSIDENSININNKVYNWDYIDNDNRNINIEREFKEKSSENNSNKKLPSIEELTKEREKLFKDIK